MAGSSPASCQQIVDIDHGRYLVTMVQHITGRKAAQEEIKRLNTDLETQVAELKEANLEQEAFNHMVSHDLRQPLNNIGLAIQAVEMLCGNAMDEECKSHGRSIYRRTLAMSNQIDTLLNFSQSTRGELRREVVDDLSGMAKGIAAEVRLAAPHWRATFRIADGLQAKADPDLIRAVVENLIGNARKYTSMSENTVIEFGATEAEGIFAPFKRPPEAGEVGGFGVGRATVERIIRRHRGRVWAHSERDKDAILYLTLP